MRGLTSMEHPNGLKFNEHIKRVLESKQNKYCSSYPPRRFKAWHGAK